jgi:hypothetical protein
MKTINESNAILDKSKNLKRIEAIILVGIATAAISI